MSSLSSSTTRLSTPLRLKSGAACWQAIATLQTTPDLLAGVLIGAGSTFIAGSDLREFGKPLEAPDLPTVIAAIEACSKPVVAALHGAALGGGFELALGCDARVAAVKTVVGLPEVTLGIIPGAGGTQRVPRRVGVARAIQMICSGERIPSGKALELRLIDEVADADLRAAAVAHARSLAGRKCRIRDQAVLPDDPAAIESAVQSALRAGKRRPAVIAAIEAIQASARLPIDDALASERCGVPAAAAVPRSLRAASSIFCRARSDEAAAGAAGNASPCADGRHHRRRHHGLRHCHQRARRRHGRAAGGAGCSRVAARQRAHPRALQQPRGQRQAQGEPGGGQRIPPDADHRLGAATPRRPVIEAVFEEMAVKHAVFAKIDAHARAGAVLATNTSYLDVDAIAQATSRPQDVLGLHFFSPANVMKLLEVVRGAKTAPEVLATGMALAKRLGKQPVVTGNAFGFIGNRIYNAYRKQCEFMLEDGAWPEQVDAALQAFGFAMGPFAVADLSGLDIAWRMRRAQAASRNPQERYVAILDHLCEQGRLGQKSGAGYYTYPEGKRSATTDQTVRGIIEQASAQRGIERRSLSDEEIQRRALLAMVNEAALLLAEGVASRATDIDVVMVQGYGFPRWEGGPVFWARQQGAAALQAGMDELARCSGSGFVRANLAVLLD